MKKKVTEELKEIIFKYGISICNEPKRLKGLLNDLWLGYPKENFVLLTADEHEYAMRGGKDGNRTTYAGSINLDKVGWYGDNSNVANK